MQGTTITGQLDECIFASSALNVRRAGGLRNR